MKKIYTLYACAALVSGFLVATTASAHVVVKPNTVGIGSSQTFSVGVMTEKDIPTVGLKLIVPQGLTDVAPNTKPGWKITEKETGEGEAAVVTEIDWTGGSIPAGERDDFIFGAIVPSATTTLTWKVYQTYADGSVVSWDRSPAETITDFSKMGPYSQTDVIDDLSVTPSSAADASSSQSISLVLSIIALALSAAAFGVAFHRKNY